MCVCVCVCVGVCVCVCVFNCAQVEFEELTGSTATHCRPHIISPVIFLQSSPASGHCGGEEDQVTRHQAKALEHLEAIMDRELESVNAPLCMCPRSHQGNPTG